MTDKEDALTRQLRELSRLLAPAIRRHDIEHRSMKAAEDEDFQKFMAQAIPPIL